MLIILRYCNKDMLAQGFSEVSLSSFFYIFVEGDKIERRNIEKPGRIFRARHNERNSGGNPPNSDIL